MMIIVIGCFVGEEEKTNLWEEIWLETTPGKDTGTFRAHFMIYSSLPVK